MFTKGEYVRGTMTKDEEIRVVAKYHWVAWLEFYGAFITLGLASILCFILSFMSYSEDQFDLTIIYAVGGVLLAIYPFILYLGLYLTEMVCTNRRVVSRTGIISIKTEEIKIDRMESIQIKQSIIGRILGYGNLLFSGTGTAKVEFYNIDNPYSTKARIEETVDEVNRELGRSEKKLSVETETVK